MELNFLKEDQRNIFLMESKIMLMPIKWEEPFGMVMIEAMACGTPVVAYARGSVPEVIKDGETGLIVNPSEEDKRGDWIIKKTGYDQHTKHKRLTLSQLGTWIAEQKRELGIK